MDLDSRYELLEKIGSGSFATVYRARDRELAREVAVKQIHEEYLANPKQLDRYWQEAQLLASMQHPNIITIYDIVRERGWLVMELMQTNLADRMEGRQLDLKALRTTTAHCLRALKYLHSRGIVHGDIKPSNMMIDARKRIKLGDFGLARRVSDEDGSLLKGTTKYMAPEVVSDEFGDVGPASDLYSLGFSAYELMCGPNFESLFPGLNAFGRNMQAAWMMWHAAPDRRLPEIKRVLEGVPEDLAYVIERLTEKDQSKRFPSCDEALAALNVDLKIVKTGGGNDDSEPHESRSEGGEKKKQRMIAIGAFAVSIILCLLLLFVPSGGNEGPPEIKKTIGIVKAIFPDNNSLKVEDPEDGIAEEKKLGKRPLIQLTNTGENLLLREILPGDRVEIEQAINDDGKPYIKVMVSRPVSSQGEIKTIDLQDKRIVVGLTEGENRDDLPLRIPDRAEIFLNGEKVVLGKTVRLRDVKEGDRVEVTHLNEAGGKRGRYLDQLRITRIQEGVGFVDKFDPVDHELIVKFGRGNNASSIRLPVAENCKISVPAAGGNPTKQLEPRELRPGDRVKYTYDNAFRTILVTREKLKVSGVVQRVSTIGSGSIVVSTSDNKKLTIYVDSDQSDVRLSSKPVEISNLRHYDQVVVLYDEDQDGKLIARTIDASRPVKNDRWAIVIGIEGFQDKFLSPLRYSINSANRIKELLLERYAVNNDRLLVLLDEDRDEIKQKISELLQEARSQTQVLVYVSTHAYVGDDDRVYLAGRDFNWDQIAETGLSLDWLTQQLDACSSKDKILLLDTSHAGAGKDLEREPSTAAMLKRLQMPLKSTFAVASCADDQRGLGSQEERSSLFAHFLAEAIGGNADIDRDLHLTATELFDYLRKNMQAASDSGGQPQTPVLFRPQ